MASVAPLEAQAMAIAAAVHLVQHEGQRCFPLPPWDWRSCIWLTGFVAYARSPATLVSISWSLKFPSNLPSPATINTSPCRRRAFSGWLCHHAVGGDVTAWPAWSCRRFPPSSSDGVLEPWADRAASNQGGSCGRTRCRGHYQDSAMGQIISSVQVFHSVQFRVFSVFHSFIPLASCLPPRTSSSSVPAPCWRSLRQSVGPSMPRRWVVARGAARRPLRGN